MRNIFKAGSAAIIGALLFAQPAMGHSFDRREVNGDTVAEVLIEQGYRAQVTVDGVGDPLVRTTMSGITVNIYFYNCNDEQTGCEDIQFSAGFDLEDGLSQDKVEEWNEDKLYGTAYLDDENDPFVKITVQVGPGGTPELIKGYVSTVETVLEQFKGHIGFRG